MTGEDAFEALLQHRRTTRHQQYEADIARWHQFGARCRERWGTSRHTSDRDALNVLVAVGALPPGHEIAPRDVYAMLAPTRSAARAAQLTNRYGPWRHPSWGPVPFERGWLYVLDFRPEMERRRRAIERNELTCGCLRDPS